MTKNLAIKLEIYIMSLNKYMKFKSLYKGKLLQNLEYCKYKVIK